MSTTWLALVVKPLIAMGFAAVYYFGIIVPVRWVQRRYPHNRVVQFLFRERGGKNPRRAADPDHRLLK